jgi:hypothetical protein
MITLESDQQIIELPPFPTSIFYLFTFKVLTRVYHYPPSPQSYGIIDLGGNSSQVFEFTGLTVKVSEN